MSIHSPSGSSGLSQKTFNRRQILEKALQCCFAGSVASMLNSCGSESLHNTLGSYHTNFTALQSGESLLRRPFHISYTDDEGMNHIFRIYLVDATTIEIDGEQFQLESIVVNDIPMKSTTPIANMYTLKDFVTDIAKHECNSKIVFRSPLGSAEIAAEELAKLAYLLKNTASSEQKIPSGHFVPCSVQLSAEGSGLLALQNVYSFFVEEEKIDIPNGCTVHFSRTPQEQLTAGTLAIQ